MGIRETYVGVDKMIENELQALLDSWIEKYCPENKDDIIFLQFAKHNKYNYEGWTAYEHEDWRRELRYAFICMKPLYKNRPTLRKIVLWHEFCHAWSWCSIGVTGHGWEFFKRIIQKPHLFLGQVGLAFVVPFLKG